MPELPEVEVVRRGLEAGLTGRTVASVEPLHPRVVRRHVAGPVDFAARLTGRRIEGARRRGKYLWLPLDDGSALLAHLGMSGQLLLPSPGSADELHLRLRVRLTDGGRELRFVDQRTFGGLALAARAEGGGELPDVPDAIAHIARDPLDPLFEDAAFVRAVRGRRTGIKRALLDQTLVSGVGNIYADEALWRSRLHFARPTETLRRGEVLGLLAAARAVLSEALAQGGTSFDALYVNVNGESGWFDRSLDAYGRAGLPCRRCGTPMRRDSFMGRSSTTCPRCQPKPRRGRW